MLDTSSGSQPGLGWAIEVLSRLLENPAVLDPGALVDLSRQVPYDWISTCLLETVASVENPFVAGITLSVALSKAAVVAPHGERRKIISLQKKLDNLLLEILERLPQTVQGFHGGMAGCAAVLEPEVEAGDARGLLGPLWMVHQSREHMETFCGQPLIVDFLSRRFAYGLPDLLGPTCRSVPEGRSLVHGAAHCPCLVIDVQDKLTLYDTYLFKPKILDPGHILDSLLSPCAMLQGVDTSIDDMHYMHGVSLSVLAGAQFLTAGLVAMPEAYYRVPDLRMTLDVIVYLVMLVVFSVVVLLHDDGPLTAGEALFASYVIVSIWTLRVAVEETQVSQVAGSGVSLFYTSCMHHRALCVKRLSLRGRADGAHLFLPVVRPVPGWGHRGGSRNEEGFQLVYRRPLERG